MFQLNDKQTSPFLPSNQLVCDHQFLYKMLYEGKQFYIKFWKSNSRFFKYLLTRMIIEPKLKKISPRSLFAIFPIKQSRFKWTLSIPVRLMAFSLFYVPGIFLKNSSVSSEGPEWDWVKPNFVSKRDFLVKIKVWIIFKLDFILISSIVLLTFTPLGNEFSRV